MSEPLYELYAATLQALRAAPFDLCTLETVQREALLGSHERRIALTLALSDYLARTPPRSQRHFGRTFDAFEMREWDARGSNPEPTA